jgi:DNA-binding GntR family transcriptional regulator
VGDFCRTAKRPEALSATHCDIILRQAAFRPGLTAPQQAHPATGFLWECSLVEMDEENVDAGGLGELATVTPLPAERTVEQSLVRALRTSILRGELAPGLRLRYRPLAAQFQVSVTPVRIALRELAKEGLVVMTPHEGAYVAPLSVTELEELFAMRTGVESWLARLGAESLSDGGLALMQRRFDDAAAAVDAADGTTYLNLGWQVRLTCYDAAQRPHLLARSKTLFEQSSRYTSLTLTAPVRVKDSFHSLTIFKAACEARDGRLAQQTIQAALERTFEYLVEHGPELDPAAGADS